MLATLLAAGLLAGSPPSPTERVKQGQAEIEKVLASADATPERLSKVTDEFLDFAELAKRALGKEWDKLSGKQRAELSTTVRGLLRASYALRALGGQGR